MANDRDGPVWIGDVFLLIHCCLCLIGIDEFYVDPLYNVLVLNLCMGKKTKIILEILRKVFLVAH